MSELAITLQRAALKLKPLLHPERATNIFEDVVLSKLNTGSDFVCVETVGSVETDVHKGPYGAEFSFNVKFKFPFGIEPISVKEHLKIYNRFLRHEAVVDGYLYPNVLYDWLTGMLQNIFGEKIQCDGFEWIMRYSALSRRLMPPKIDYIFRLKPMVHLDFADHPDLAKQLDSDDDTWCAKPEVSQFWESTGYTMTCFKDYNVSRHSHTATELLIALCHAQGITMDNAVFRKVLKHWKKAGVSDLASNFINMLKVLVENLGKDTESQTKAKNVLAILEKLRAGSEPEKVFEIFGVVSNNASLL